MCACAYACANCGAHSMQNCMRASYDSMCALNARAVSVCMVMGGVLCVLGYVIDGVSEVFMIVVYGI
jgi:hypothetical protein